MIQFFAMFMGPMVATALFAGWWLFFSRLPLEGALDGARGVHRNGVDRDAAGTCDNGADAPGGFRAAFDHRCACAIWLLVTPFLRWPVRRLGLLAMLVLGWGYFTLVRLDGIDGSMHASLSIAGCRHPKRSFWPMPAPHDKLHHRLPSLRLANN